MLITSWSPFSINGLDTQPWCGAHIPDITGACCEIDGPRLVEIYVASQHVAVINTVLFVTGHNMICGSTGSHAPKAAEAFPIIQRCMEVLGLHASPNVVSAALDICLVAVKERSDFQVGDNFAID